VFFSGTVLAGSSRTKGRKTVVVLKLKVSVVTVVVMCL